MIMDRLHLEIDYHDHHDHKITQVKHDITEDNTNYKTVMNYFLFVKCLCVMTLPENLYRQIIYKIIPERLLKKILLLFHVIFLS